MDEKGKILEEIKVQEKISAKVTSSGASDRLRRTNRECDENASPIVPAKKLRSIVRSLEFGRACEESCEYHLSTVESHLANVKEKAAEKIRQETVINASKATDNMDSGFNNIENREVWGASELASDTDSDDAVIFKHLGIAIQRINTAIQCIDPILNDVIDNPFEDDVSDEEKDPLAYTSDNDDDMEGYESDNEGVNLQWLNEDSKEVLSGRSVSFADDRINMATGKLFHNALVFRHSIKALAQRDCFNLCPMINNRQCISCECSDMGCDWYIEGKKLKMCPMFEVTNFNPVHTCKKKRRYIKGTSVWVAYEFLHKWIGDVKVTENAVKDEISTIYGVDCPIGKMNKAQRLGREILGADHAEAYTKLTNFAAAVEGLTDSHKVMVEIESNLYFREPRFKGIFLCFYDTRWAFKNSCRPFIALDGWPLGGEYGGVMLTALGLDGNDGILPIAMYEVKAETSLTWYEFLEKLNMVLLVEKGEGYCVISDEENGLAEALEMKFFEAEIRICAAKVYERMRASFPSPILGRLFWKACRSTTAHEFNCYMAEIKSRNELCHAWLIESRWEKWALHCMPKWTKNTHVTNAMSEQFQLWMENYYAQNITRRFEGLARKIEHLMDRRRSVDWLLKEKVTPVVHQKVMKAIKAAQHFIVHTGEYRSFTVTDNRNEQFEVDIEERNCSCGGWQLSGIPCAHATKCIISINQRCEEYVDPMLNNEKYNRTYAKKMEALPKEEFWPTSTIGPLLPPCKEEKKIMVTDSVGPITTSSLETGDTGNVDGRNILERRKDPEGTGSHISYNVLAESSIIDARIETSKLEVGEIDCKKLANQEDEGIGLMCLSESEGSLEF